MRTPTSEDCNRTDAADEYEHMGTDGKSQAARDRRPVREVQGHQPDLPPEQRGRTHVVRTLAQAKANHQQRRLATWTSG